VKTATATAAITTTARGKTIHTEVKDKAEH